MTAGGAPLSDRVYSPCYRTSEACFLLKNVISISRRTDIPAFYADWFVERIRQGAVFAKNPYSGKFSTVSLKPGDVSCFVFWSKDYSPLIPHLGTIEEATKNLYFHLTITGMPDSLESNTPPPEDALHDFRYLAGRYSPDHVMWRFDPICVTDKLPFEFFEEMFVTCAEKVRGYCRNCVISFVHAYKKVQANFENYSDHILMDVPEGARKHYAQRLGKIAERYGIKLHACCNDHLLSDTVHKGRCINGASLERLMRDPSITTQQAPTRRACACTKSIDIGAYDTCPHGCLYCYANADREKSRAACLRQDVAWNALGADVDEAAERDEHRQYRLF